MGVKHTTMRMGTPEYERYSEMLQLCRKGTPDELLAYIQKCCYSSRILNTGHIITTSMAAMVDMPLVPIYVLIANDYAREVLASYFKLKTGT